ncbi:PREDICTED: uncharacterized protein LOC109175137 [Ipomoea nil]|uniref:uncharacterized protein LOC109175137 n=1 Tax=Ipomoea nil TaxID=35883 RepID=UPI000901E427|nr:PREDICTED: uncharacterized protein LOC109175137 [Ipomoea nil]
MIVFIRHVDSSRHIVESRDISVKEQMIVFIRHVDSSRHIVEHLLGITHVCDTTSMSLKVVIEDLLTSHKLSISRIRDQGYVGASNMRVPGRPRRKAEKRTHLHKYRVERFYVVLDLQLHELNNRFNEKNTELLLCVACFDPKNSFARFDKDKLVRFAQFYPNDFSDIELQLLDNQLQTYFVDVTSDPAFSKLDGIDELAKKNGENGKTFGLYDGVFASKVVFDPTGCNC